ncbi:MAG: hypothetical protein WC365_00620 [Candidatus Babeliales bacterium]|jgi:hypothetical protein
MLRYEEFEDIWKKKRCTQDTNTPSPEVWKDITKVFKTCEELYHRNKVYRAILEEITLAYDEYVKALTDELSETTGLAYAHGWHSKRGMLGEELRRKIAVIKRDAASLKGLEG